MTADAAGAGLRDARQVLARDARQAFARDARDIVVRDARDIVVRDTRQITACDPREMVVAGIGFASAATATEIASLVRDCLAGRTAASLAVPASRASLDAALEAARLLGLALVAVPDTAIERAQDRCLTPPTRAAHAVAEAAALAAAGDDAVLLGPRRKGPRVTCALAAARDDRARDDRARDNRARDARK